MKYTNEDFQLGITPLINNIGLKTKYIDKSTQTSCLFTHPERRYFS